MSIEFLRRLKESCSPVTSETPRDPSHLQQATSIEASAISEHACLQLDKTSQLDLENVQQF